MKEFVEKLIGRLEEIYDRNDKAKKEAYEEQDWERFDLFTDRNEGIYSAISIVNQLAEEYNNGWIPCSERLPEKEMDVLVCFSNDMDCVIAYRTKMMNTNLKDVWVNSSTAHIISSNVIAWQPLPAPFKKGSDVDYDNV